MRGQRGGVWQGEGAEEKGCGRVRGRGEGCGRVKGQRGGVWQGEGAECIRYTVVCNSLSCPGVPTMYR